MKHKVPFVNYPLQYFSLKKEIDGTISRVLKNGDLILRKDVEDFEKSIAKFSGVKYAVGVNSGTDALIFSLIAAGIKEGDEVITVSHTFFATIEAIHHCKARPILIDVRDDFLMDESKLERAINRRTKAVILVHLNGFCCNMEKIMKIAKKHKLLVIEDTAQALGAKYKGKEAGSFGIAGCFSFYPAKSLGCFGDGGAVATNSFPIAEKVRLLSNHGQKTKKSIVCYGFTSRLDNIQAAVLNVKIKYLPKWIKRRREIAGIYSNGLLNIKEIKTPLVRKGCFDTYQNYVIRAEKRDQLFDFLKKKGVETLIKDSIPNHLQKGLNLNKFSLPKTEEFAKQVISLPMYPELKNNQIDYVIKQLKDFYGEK